MVDKLNTWKKSHFSIKIEFISNSEIEEHKILAQQLICKIKRKELLTFIHAKKIEKQPKESKTQLFIMCSLKPRIDWLMNVASFLSEEV